MAIFRLLTRRCPVLILGLESDILFQAVSECPEINSVTQREKQKAEHSDPTWIVREACAVQLPAVELQANDSKHQDGKEEQEADLQKGHHGLHNGLQHNLQTWKEGKGMTDGASLSTTWGRRLSFLSPRRRRASLAGKRTLGSEVIETIHKVETRTCQAKVCRHCFPWGSILSSWPTCLSPFPHLFHPCCLPGSFYELNWLEWASFLKEVLWEQGPVVFPTWDPALPATVARAHLVQPLFIKYHILWPRNCTSRTLAQENNQRCE